MIINTIGSGSKGNAYIVSDGVNALLLEAGLKWRDICNKMIGYNVRGCLVTHEHGDHARCVKEVLSKCIPVYSSEGTFNSLGITDINAKSVKHAEPFYIATFRITPFSTEHDAAEPFGYLIYSSVTQESLLFATDTYYIKHRFKNLNYIMVECNYDKELLDDSYISEVQKKRTLVSHFELHNVMDFLAHQDLSNCKEIHLLHLSARHSNEQDFIEKIQGETMVPTYVAPERNY